MYVPLRLKAKLTERCCRSAPRRGNVDPRGSQFAEILRPQRDVPNGSRQRGKSRVRWASPHVRVLEVAQVVEQRVLAQRADRSGLVDLPVIDSRRKARKRLPHHAGVELLRRLGPEIGVSSGQGREERGAVGRQIRDRAACGVVARAGERRSRRRVQIGNRGWPESCSVGRSQQQRPHGLPSHAPPSGSSCRRNRCNGRNGLPTARPARRRWGRSARRTRPPPNDRRQRPGPSVEHR